MSDSATEGHVWALQTATGEPSRLFVLCWRHLDSHYSQVVDVARTHWSTRGVFPQWLDVTAVNSACRVCGWAPRRIGDDSPVQPFVGPRTVVHAGVPGEVMAGEDTRALCNRVVRVRELLDPGQWEQIVRHDAATLRTSEARGCRQCTAVWKWALGAPKLLTVR